MDQDFPRLSRIIFDVTILWSSYFSNQSNFRERYFTERYETEYAERLTTVRSLFFEIIEQQFKRRPYPNEITLSAVFEMQRRADDLRRSKRAKLTEYSDELLELYVADFLSRTSTHATRSHLFERTVRREVVITAKDVDDTANELPEDLPTDWWRKRLSELGS